LPRSPGFAQDLHTVPLIYDPPTNLCASCRYLSSGVTFYEVGPPAVDYKCAKQHRNKVPNVVVCETYEREPGAD